MTATIGDNNPPASEAFAMAIDDLNAEAKNFLDGEPIENEGQADALTDILDGMKQLSRDAEKSRKAEKEPHLKAGKEVDTRWKEPIDKAKLVISVATGPLTVWRQKVQAEKDAEQKRLREIAEKAEREAQAERANAVSLEDAEQAEEKLKQSKIATATANKIDRTATGLRTYWEAEITDYGALLAFIKKTNSSWLKDRLDEYAQQRVHREHSNMPGVIAHEKKRAA